MATETWGEADFTPEEWAELAEDIRVCEEEEARGEYEEYGPGDGEKFLEGVIARGRAILSAERQKVS